MELIDLKTPDWSLEMVRGAETIRTTIHDSAGVLPTGIVPARTEVVVSGVVSATSHVYLLTLHADESIDVLFDSGAVPVASGTSVRVPKTGRLTLTEASRLRIVEAPRAIAPHEWAELLRDRDPKPEGASVKNSVRDPARPVAPRGNNTTEATAEKKRPAVVHPKK